MPIVSVAEWNDFYSKHSEAHFLQSSAWGEVKAAFGWYPPVYIISGTAGAQILFHKLPLGIKIGHIAGGPIGTNYQELWKELDKFCREQKAVFIKVEPHAYEPLDEALKAELKGFTRTNDYIIGRRSILVDLTEKEDVWLARMKPKTRYNIGLANRKGIKVVMSENIESFTTLIENTAERHDFKPRGLAYYQKVYQSFISQKASNSSIKGVLLQAEFDKKPVAAVIVIANGEWAWHLYAGTSNNDRHLMPSYPLILECMRWAANQGCRQFDFWGIPDYDEEILENTFSTRSDGSWGVYRFKRGFGGKIIRSVGAWDRVYNYSLYSLYKLYTSKKSRYTQPRS
jgi:peptidoglycan pentaglycine glycine transferase (the first glycine)